MEAMRLLERGDKPAAELARELGVRRNRLYTRQQEVSRQGTQAFPGSGRPASDKDAEIARLTRELERVSA